MVWLKPEIFTIPNVYNAIIGTILRGIPDDRIVIFLLVHNRKEVILYEENGNKFTLRKRNHDEKMNAEEGMGVDIRINTENASKLSGMA